MVVRCVPVLNETAGYTYHICTICGHNEQLSSIPALEHHYDSMIIAPTCCSGGYTTHRCPECSDHYTDNYVEAMGHLSGEWIVAIAATETSEDERYIACMVCEEDLLREGITKIVSSSCVCVGAS